MICIEQLTELNCRVCGSMASGTGSTAALPVHVNMHVFASLVTDMLTNIYARILQYLSPPYWGLQWTFPDSASPINPCILQTLSVQLFIYT
jgi:hypothetical protein